MALRARFVGGRGSGSPGGGVVRERTVADEVVARCCFGRGAEDEDEEGSALVSSGMVFDVHPDRAPTKVPFYLFISNPNLVTVTRDSGAVRVGSCRSLKRKMLYDRRPEMIRTASIKSGHDQRERTEMTAVSAHDHIPRRRLIYTTHTTRSCPPWQVEHCSFLVTSVSESNSQTRQHPPA